MNYFVPASDVDHALALRGFDMLDVCRCCGFDFTAHTNERCPDDNGAPTGASR